MLNSLAVNEPVVLVTGATGFIGSAICTALASYVRIRAVSRHKEISRLADNSDFFYGELRSDFDWAEGLRNVRTIIHCAARVHMLKEESDNPLRDFRAINVDGTLALARQAAANGVRRFIFLSSIGVLGAKTTGRPYRYDDPPAPHSPYAISKLEAELALQQLSVETGLEVVIIRPPLVYGPTAPGNFANLIKIVASGVPLPFACLTNNRRSFLFIDNLTDFIKCCIDHPRAANRVFLVADSESFSTTELLRHMGKAFGRPAHLFPIPVVILQFGAAILGKQEMVQRLYSSLEVDITQTTEVLGWKPPFSFDEGLSRTISGWLATQQDSNR